MCGQMFNPDKIDVNTLNIKGIPKQVEISEESLCSEKDIEKQKLFFVSFTITTPLLGLLPRR